MEDYILQVKKDLLKTKNLLKRDSCLEKDIDFNYNFISPFSNAKTIDSVKLIIIGQDPTIRNIESRKEIKTTLNLDKSNSLKIYLKRVCEILEIDIETEIYATNLYKCFFHFPPADDETILTRQFKIWCDFLINELKPFENQIFITLGEPLLRQLIHSSEKKVNYYWDYIGNTQSNLNFKFIGKNKNYLQRRIFPIAHQPTWSQNEFYKKYLFEYLQFIKSTNTID